MTSSVVALSSVAGTTPLVAQNGDDDDTHSTGARIGFTALGVYGGASVGMLTGIGMANVARLVDPDNEAYRPIGMAVAIAGLAAGGIIGAAEPDLLEDVAVRAAIGAGVGGVAGTLLGATSKRPWEWILAGVGTGILVGQVAGALIEDDEAEGLPVTTMRRGVPVVFRVSF